jgi:transposase
MEKRRTFTAEFKLEAIRLALTPGNSIMWVANDLGVGRSTLTHWIREYRKKGGTAFPGHGNVALTPQEAEIQRLKRELEIPVRSGIFSKRRRPSSPKSLGEIRLHRAGAPELPGRALVQSDAGVQKWLLCVAKKAEKQAGKAR